MTNFYLCIDKKIQKLRHIVRSLKPSSFSDFTNGVDDALRHNHYNLQYRLALAISLREMNQLLKASTILWDIIKLHKEKQFSHLNRTVLGHFIASVSHEIIKCDLYQYDIDNAIVNYSLLKNNFFLSDNRKMSSKIQREINSILNQPGYLDLKFSYRFKQLQWDIDDKDDSEVLQLVDQVSKSREYSVNGRLPLICGVVLIKRKQYDKAIAVLLGLFAKRNHPNIITHPGYHTFIDSMCRYLVKAYVEGGRSEEALRFIDENKSFLAKNKIVLDSEADKALLSQIKFAALIPTFFYFSPYVGSPPMEVAVDRKVIQRPLL